MTTRVLRPRLRRRLPYFVGALALFAFSVVGVFYNPIVGALGIVLFGFAAVNAALRLFHPRSYATELGPTASASSTRGQQGARRELDGRRAPDGLQRQRVHGPRHGAPRRLALLAACPARVGSRGCAAARTSWVRPTTARSRTRTSASSRC